MKYTVFIPYVKGDPLMLLMCLSSINLQEGDFDVFVSANGEEDESIDFNFFKKMFNKNNLIINDNNKKRPEYSQQIELYPKFLKEGRKDIIYCHEDVIFTKRNLIRKIIENTKGKEYTFHGKFHLRLNETPTQSRYNINTYLHYYNLEKINKLSDISDINNWIGRRINDNGHKRLFDSGFGRFAYYVYEENNYLRWKDLEYGLGFIHIGGFTYRKDAKDKFLKVKNKIKTFIDYAKSIDNIENTNFYKKYVGEYS